MIRIITFVFILGILAVVFAPSLAQAGQSDTVAVKVTITPSISVNITEGELVLGSVAAGGAKVSTTALTVTNNGSGINETYSLSLSNPSGWTATPDAAGVEEYVLNAAFSNAVGGITWNNASHALSVTPVVCTGPKFAGDQTGVGVPYNAVRKLWLQFLAPTATTVSTEQTIVVTITAQAA